MVEKKALDRVFYIKEVGTYCNNHRDRWYHNHTIMCIYSVISEILLARVEGLKVASAFLWSIFVLMPYSEFHAEVY